MHEDRVPMPSCFYHFGEFIVPKSTPNPFTEPTEKCLVGCWTGTGQVDALCYRTDYYGVWFGFEIDDYPLVVAHNGHCLQNMGLIGAAAAGMPYYLPYFNSPEDLSVACRNPLRFNRSFKLWMGNSHPDEDKRCIGLHVYVTGWDIEPTEGNMLDWDVALGKRHPNTRVSSETILLTQFEQKG